MKRASFASSLSALLESLLSSLSLEEGGFALVFLDLVFSLALSARLLTVKFRQPCHEFTFGVGMSFIPYPLVLTPVV
jgi:hypothetical protein